MNPAIHIKTPIKDIGDKNLFILRNHGTLSVGHTCGIAFMGIYFLERACSTQIRAQAAGEINLPSKEAIKQMIKLSKAPVMASHSSARALRDHPRNLDDEPVSYTHLTLPTKA